MLGRNEIDPSAFCHSIFTIFYNQSSIIILIYMIMRTLVDATMHCVNTILGDSCCPLDLTLQVGFRCLLVGDIQFW